MIKAFPKPPEKPKDETRTSSVGKVCEKMLRDAAAAKEIKTAQGQPASFLKGRTPAAPPAPAGAGPQQPAFTRNTPVMVPPKAKPQNPAVMNRQKKLWEAKTKTLAKEMQAMEKSINLLLASPMVAKDKTMVAFLNQYGGLLNPQMIMQNPAMIHDLTAATNELSREVGNFYSKWSGVVEKSKQSIATTMNQIFQFNKMLGSIAGFAPNTPAAPQASFLQKRPAPAAPQASPFGTGYGPAPVQ